MRVGMNDTARSSRPDTDTLRQLTHDREFGMFLLLVGVNHRA